MLKVLISQYISLTKIKIFGARILYYGLKLFLRSDYRVVNRKGINYSLDLSEGIDLSLFMFGGFQSQVLEHRGLKLPLDAVMFDIGANIGAMSLSFAKLYPSSVIYSFEPTEYALQKFKKNLSLNKSLEKNINLENAILGETNKPERTRFYSSWKVIDQENNSGSHDVHGGIYKEAANASVTTIDLFSNRMNIEKLNLIKIDTDGSELAILKGGVSTIEKFRPVIVFEIGLYLLEERNLSFEDYFIFFDTRNYTLKEAGSEKIVTMQNYKKIIPNLGTTDLVATHNEV